MAGRGLTGMVTGPKVTVFCLTFNQAKFVRQSLDSILVQKTDFPFEILINDDASTDGTVEIIEEYQKRYPSIIKPTFHKQNLYSQGQRNFVVRFLLPKARGNYLAICEGDDYWTDETKLQRQADFLDGNPDYALCFHPVRVFFEKNKQEDVIFPDPSVKRKYTVKELLNSNYIQTNSVMYRKQTYDRIATNVAPADWYLHLYHAQYGKIGFINEVMADYRRHSGGIWWDSHGNMNKFWRKHGMAHMACYKALLDLYGDTPDYAKIISRHMRELGKILMGLDKTSQSHLLRSALHDMPEVAERIIIGLNKELNIQTKKTQDTERTVGELQELIAQKDKEIALIKSSRVWKSRTTVAKIIGKDKARGD